MGSECLFGAGGGGLLRNTAPISVHLWLRKKQCSDRRWQWTDSSCQPDSIGLDSTRLEPTRLDPARLVPSSFGLVRLPAQAPPCLPKTCQVFQDAREGTCQGPGIEGWASLGVAPQGASCPIRVVSHWRIAHCGKLGLISILARPQRHARGPAWHVRRLTCRLTRRLADN